MLASSGASLLGVQAQTAPATGLSAKQRQAYNYLIHPEPRAMRSNLSRTLSGELNTVFTPASYKPETQQLEGYSEANFKKLGIGWESFYAKAQESANFILSTLTPKPLRANGAQNAPIEALVYTGDEAWYSSLMIASLLLTTVQPYLGDHIIVAAPDRYALYVFPAKTEILSKYTVELFERYENSPFASSEEFFSIKTGTTYPAVVGNFSGR